MMRHTNVSGRLSVLLATLITVSVITACSDPTLSTQPKTPETKETGGGTGMRPTGTYEFSVTGIGTADMKITARQVLDADGQPLEAKAGVQGSLTEAPNLVFEQNQVSSFVEGSRSQGGQRYITLTYRVRNNSGVAYNNLTLIPNTKDATTSPASAATIPGTPWTSLKRFDGTNASNAIAQSIIPTGAVTLGDDFTMKSVYPDVLQVMTEAEVAALPLPTGFGVTGFFPYGFMIRNRLSNANRTLPATGDVNDFAGLLTFSFRFPLQAAAVDDPFSFVFWATAYQDTETRLTESIEESQDTGAVRRLRDRAVSLGATTVTVLNGSPAMDPAVPDYPGQRQICSSRTSGSAGSPTNFINGVGAYSHLVMFWPGETVDPCAAYFRGGTTSRPATNVAFPVTLKAMDRYGNVKTGITENVHMIASGPPVVIGAAANLVSGSTTINMTYTDYGTSDITAVGSRLRDERYSYVFGITRTWTAGASSTNWNDGNNWGLGAVPMSQDSVYIPASAPFMPALVSNVSVKGVTVEDVATLNLGAFDLTAGSNVSAGLNGGITNTSGRLFLAGTAYTVQGKVPTLRVTGTYSLTANVNARAPIQVDAGRLTVSALRLQADAN